MSSQTILPENPSTTLTTNSKNKFIWQLVRDYTPIVLLLLGGLLFRLYGLTSNSFSNDEAMDTRLAHETPFIKTLTFSLAWNIHPPLFFIIMHIWSTLFWMGEFSLRFFSIIMWFGTSLVLYFFTLKRLGKRLALTIVLLLALSTLDLSWSQSIRPYELFQFVVTISMVLAFWANEKPTSNWRWLAYAVSTSIMLYTHYLAFHVIFAQLVFLILVNFKNIKVLFRIGLSLLFVALSFLPYLGNFLDQSRTGPAFHLANRGPSQLIETTSYFIGFMTPNQLTLVVFAVSIPLYLFGLIWFWKKNPAMAVFFLTWSILPVLTCWISSIVRPNFGARYFNCCLPAWIILIAAGIWSFYGQRRIVSVIMLSIVLILSLFANSNFRENYANENLRGIVNFILDHNQPEDVIFLTNSNGYSDWGFDYYYSYLLGEPKNLPRIKLPQFPTVAQVEQIFNNNKRVWIVSSDDGSNWYGKNVKPVIPSGFTTSYFHEYRSYDQSTFTLFLLEKQP